MGEENTSSPGLRELSKADSQSSVACIRKLRSEYVEGEGVLLRKKSGVSFGQSPYPEGTDIKGHSTRHTRLFPFPPDPLFPLAQAKMSETALRSGVGSVGGEREQLTEAPPRP